MKQTRTAHPWNRKIAGPMVVAAFGGLTFLGVLLHGRFAHQEVNAPVPSAQVAALSLPENHSTLPATPVDPETSLLGTAASASPTEQALKLIAVFPGQAPQTGTAQLGTDPKNPQTYAAGARLSNGAVLQEIHQHYVVLARDGRKSLLFIAGSKSGRVAKDHRNIGVDATVMSIGGEEAINQPIERIASSREDLSEVLRAQPYYERDEYAGLTILPGTHSGRLNALELESGDIVRTIDGKRTSSAGEAWQLLDDAISTGTPIVVGIERDGALMSVFVDGSRLAQSSFQPVMSTPGS